MTEQEAMQILADMGLHEGGMDNWVPDNAWYRFANVVEATARADERESFYGQDKPAECVEGCPPKQICDYCQIVAPVKTMILAERADERDACAKVCDNYDIKYDVNTCDTAEGIALEIRARGTT